MFPPPMALSASTEGGSCDKRRVMSANKGVLDTLDIVGNDTYADNGYPHEAWTLLRREAPVYWYERPGIVPFWAVTRHEDIVKISRQPKIFQNAPRLAVFPELETGEPPDREFARHLLNMDPPEHGRFRKLASHRFTPRTVQSLRESMEKITRDFLDEFAGDGTATEGDFVTGVSARIPLAVLADMLGVPRSDWELMFQWTNEIIGSTDPDYQHGGSAEETADAARMSLFSYFVDLAEKRRREPRHDIVSVLANAELEGAPVPQFELLSYFFLLVVAGNETTRNAMSGGLLAFIDNPGELDKLRQNPTLIDSAVEEIVRWTSPVIQFCRTPNQDVEIRGQRIKAGQNMTLFYPSANRDEDVFGDPFRFRIDRNPNPHLAFGIGEHFCLGANLARLELKVLFGQLAARLEEVELAGPVRRLRSSFVGGVKSVPIRYRMRPSCSSG
jgi:cytochrome P450